MRIGVIGVPGKMASRVVALAGNALTAAVSRPGDACVGQTHGNTRVTDAPDFSCADVWIEFALPEVTPQSIRGALASKKALVICTTGLSEETLALADEAAEEIPLLIAPNTSLGVAAMAAAMRLLLRALPNYACEIVEIHHDQKRDSPSGTALRLAKEVQRARPASKIVEAHHGVRDQNEVGVFGVRGGGVVGDHTVYFFGENERVEITHRAENRDLFAEGALVAARWLVKQKRGSYRMEQCLEIE